MHSTAQITKLIILALSISVIAESACGQTPTTSRTQESNAIVSYPTKPIRLIDPFPPGGGTDFVARVISPKLTEMLGQSLVIDNRSGAGGAIGSEIGARATPNGYTLLMATASTVVINPLLSKVPFDPIKDFAPVVQFTAIPLMLVVHPAVPAESVKELIALARAQPGKLNFASAGQGTLGHLAGELFKIKAGVSMVHIPYKGGGPATVGLLGGEVQIDFPNILPVLPHVKAGRIRGLAVTGPNRATAMPDLPTVAETGVAGYDVRNWNGVLAPAGTPRAIIIKLNNDIVRALNLPDIRERLVSSGAEVVGGTPEQFSNFIKTEIAKWAVVIKDSGVTLN